MKCFQFYLLLLPALLISTFAKAQGGIGNKPRTDLVMLSASVRDSLSDEVFQHILDLRHYAETDLVDSAAPWIAFQGNADKTDRWARAINLSNPDEKARVVSIFEKLKKLFHDYPDTHREYYAVFKTKDAPSGQLHLYQIHHVNGKKQRMVSWNFYPIGDRLLLGDFN
jgi:hypothetical protein